MSFLLVTHRAQPALAASLAKRSYERACRSRRSVADQTPRAARVRTARIVSASSNGRCRRLRCDAGIRLWSSSASRMTRSASQISSIASSGPPLTNTASRANSSRSSTVSSSCSSRSPRAASAGVSPRHGRRAGDPAAHRGGREAPPVESRRAGRRELHGQREIVQLRAQLGHGGRLLEGRVCTDGAADEERDGVLAVHRVDWVDVLAGQPEELARRDQDADVGAAPEQRREVGRCP